MRVLAIDPGYGRVGIAVVEKGAKRHRVVTSHCFTTLPNTPFYARLVLILGRLDALIAQYAPDVLAAETLFFNTNQKTALYVAEARGALIVHAASQGLKILEYTPLQVKCAVTGYGRATKKQIINMVGRLTDIPEGRRTDDEYDAIAVGITCLVSQKLYHNLHTLQ
jgi:crossover junction endodeoxyribonuclease RuvC